MKTSSKFTTTPLLLSAVAATLLFAGCASTKVSDRQVLLTEKLPRPGNILVYDFASTSGEVPSESALAGASSVQATPLTVEEIATGHQVGAAIAAQLVEEIGVMGMPAHHASAGTKPQINDIVIRGYLLSVDEGSAAKRVTLGFGAGSSKLTIAVEGYQMTANGLRKLGSGKVDAGGSKTPGAALGVAAFIATANPVGLIVSAGTKVYGEASGSSKIEGRAKATAKEIGDQLKIRFQEQGWIAK